MGAMENGGHGPPYASCLVAPCHARKAYLVHRERTSPCCPGGLGVVFLMRASGATFSPPTGAVEFLYSTVRLPHQIEL